MGRLWVFFGMLFVGLMLWQGPAWGEAEAEGLRGFKAVKILVEELTPDAGKCGLTKHNIKTALSYPISISKLKIYDDGELTLYVSVTTIHVESINSCSSHIRIEAFTYERVTLSATGNNVFAEILLWDVGYLWVGSGAQHSRRVHDILEEFAKDFVVDWTAAQE